MKRESWYVYILLCADGTYYTGIAKDLERRFKQHQSGKGAKYTQTHGAKRIVYSEKHSNRGAAASKEFEIKKLSRLEKKKLIQK